MLQLIEKGEGGGVGHDDDVRNLQELGNGQKIEQHMARQLKLKIFHIYRPMNKYGSEYRFHDRHIDEVVAAIKDWYNNHQDMSDVIIRPNP